MAALSATERTARSRARRAAEMERLMEALHEVLLSRTLAEARGHAAAALWGPEAGAVLRIAEALDGPVGSQEAAEGAEAPARCPDTPKEPEEPVASSGGR